MNQLNMDADAQVINLVNSAVSARQAQARKQVLDAQQARNHARRKAVARRRLIMQAVLECGSCIGISVLLYVAMRQDMISPGLAMPVAAACMILAGYRINDYIRANERLKGLR